MRIAACPYDGREIESEPSNGGTLLVCPACHAAWEWHGGWIARVREPEPFVEPATPTPRVRRLVRRGA